MHKFMATLVEIANQIQGRTVMYIPEEDLEDLEIASRDKDLVQRLEYVLIQWTRQIKEVVSNQDNATQDGEEEVCFLLPLIRATTRSYACAAGPSRRDRVLEE